MTPAKFTLDPRRLVTLVVFGLIVLLPIGWIAWCIYAAAMLEAQTAAQARQLVSLQARIETLKAAAHDHPEAPDLSAAVYFAGETPAMAGAAIQQRMADAIAGGEGRVIESQVLPPDPAVDDPGRVDLRVSFETRIAGLQRILLDIEAGSPFIFVRSVDLRSLADKQSDLDVDPLLRIELVVGGYQRMAGS